MHCGARALLSVVVLCALSAPAATLYVSSTSPTDGPGDAWSNAYHTVQDAVDAAAAGDIVRVTNGTYQLSAPLTVTNEITVSSVHGPEVTRIDGGDTVQGARIAHATLEGFTITRCAALRGGAVHLNEGGTVRGCVLTSNRALDQGGGAYFDGGGLLERCRVTGNRAAEAGGILCQTGTVRNCAVVSNRAFSVGGVGAGAAALIESCTIAANVADATAGGLLVWETVMRNTIVRDNQAPDAAEVYGVWGTVEHSCAPGLPSGSGNTTNDPEWIALSGDVYQLLPTSPCVDAGTEQPWMAGALDVAGRPRAVGASVDMGAYEYPLAVTGMLEAVAMTLPATGLTNGHATLHAEVTPNAWPTTAWFEWDTNFWGRSVFSNVSGLAEVGDAMGPVMLTVPLVGLEPGVPYHFRAVASNLLGVTHGAPRGFGCPGLEMVGNGVMTTECHTVFRDPGYRVSPEPMPATAVVSGYSHSLALLSDGTAVGWGANGNGQATGEPGGSPTGPGGQSVDAGIVRTGGRAVSNLVDLAACARYGIGVREDGTVVAWGDDMQGGNVTNPLSAVTNAVEATSCRGMFCLILRADGSCVLSYLYHGDYRDLPPRAQRNVTAVEGGEYSSVPMGSALKPDGTVVVWDAWSGSPTFPTPPEATNLVAVSAGHDHILALREDGSVLDWMAYDYTYSHRAGVNEVPPGATNIVAVAAGYMHCLALKADGTVIGWGTNTVGQLDIPAAATNVVAISTKSNTSLALRSDGSVIGWGQNDLGQADPPAFLQTPGIVAVTGTVDTNSPGVYTLTYAAHGLPASPFNGTTTVARTVVVLDTTAPVVELLGPNPLEIARGQSFVDPGAVASDACAGDLTGEIEAVGAVDASTPGAYVRSYSVTDPSGNATAASRTVWVTEPAPSPTVTVVLSGSASPGGLPALAWFEYGLTETYGSDTPPMDIGSGVDPVAMSAEVTGLLPGVTYCYRVVTSNSLGVVRGDDLTFAPSPHLVQGDADGDARIDQDEFDAVARRYWGDGARPYIDGLQLSEDGWHRMELMNSGGWSFGVEGSTNLATWEYVGPALPYLEFFDPDGANSTSRYYRLSVP